MADQNLPVVFLAFANDQGDGEGYLRQLRNEAEQLRDLLEQAGKVCQVVVRESASLKNILDVFQSPKYKHRIAIFHFGGHANSYQLLLESAEGKAMPANAAGLATFLSQQRGLHLAFLNGCATGKQAQGLLAAGVQAVIATDRKIKDDVAVEFAARFYRGLTGGDTLPDAFAAAQGAVQTDIGDDVTRAYLDEEDFGDLPPDVWPWQLYPPEIPPEIAGWKLNELAGNPYWVLPPLPSGRRLPQKPFLGLSYFREKHARIFFGRGWQILDLFKLITNDVSPVDEDAIVNPIILLYGQSGVGKSSLLAAGLLPRLKQVAQVRYVRREDARNDLTAALGQAVGSGPPSPPKGGIADQPAPFGGPGGTSEATIDDLPATEENQNGHPLADRWLAQETDERPLVIILDQVEEIYTRPNGDPKKELAAFLDSLQTIFDDDVDPWPRGKLILGFRKEWLAEIRDRLAERDLPYKEMFLKHLDRPGIIEAITGPTAQYNLVIAEEKPGEAQVPEIIADDLLADRGSAIAPTLQIILTKLWENATGKPKRFSQELYRNLRLKQANYLSQLLDKQLALLGKDHPAESASGLVLDLLAYHTTEVGTTQQRSHEELIAAYRHLPADTIKSLVQSCKDRYLLVTPAGDVDEDAPDATRLSHDTLGPLVRARFVDSQKPGQKAYRLLQNRIPDWQNGKTGPILQAEDLAIVENGLAGMRVRISEPEEDEEASPEKRLMQASLQAREQRKRDREIQARNRKILQAVGAVAVVLIALLAVVASWQWNLALKAQAKAEAEAERADRRTNIVQAQALAIASQQANSNDTLQALLAREAYNIVTDREPEVYALLDSTLRTVRNESFPASAILKADYGAAILAFNSDDQWLAAAARGPVGGPDSYFKLWSLAEPEAKSRILDAPRGWVETLAFSSDDQWLAAGSGDSNIYLWPLADPEAEPRILDAPEETVYTLAFSSDDQWLAAGSRDSNVYLWPLADPEAEPRILDAPEEAVYTLAFSSDDQWLAAGSWDSNVYLWSLAEPEAEPRILDAPKGWVETLAFSSDDHWLAAGSRDSNVYLWSLAKPEAETRILDAPRGWVETLAFSSDDQWLAAGSLDSNVYLWLLAEMEMEAEPRILDAPREEVETLAFSSDDQWLAAGSRDSNVYLWPLADPEAEPRILNAPREWVETLAFSSDDQWLAAGSRDSNVYLWPLAEMEMEAEPRILDAPREEVETLAFSSDDQWLAAGSRDSNVYLWPLAEMEAEPRILDAPREEVSTVAFSSDDQWLAAGSWDSNVYLWPLAKPEAEPRILDAPREEVWTLAFSSDDQWLAAGSWDSNVYLWPLAKPEAEPRILDAPREAVSTVAFSSDDQWLAAASGDSNVYLWPLAEMEAEPRILDVPEAVVLTLAFSSDDQWLAAASGDSNVYLWPLAEMEAEPRILDVPEAVVLTLRAVQF